MPPPATLRRLAANAHRLRHDDRGRVTAFAVVMVNACLFVAGLVLDGGIALTAKVDALGQAQEAARAGAQQVDLGAYRGGVLRLDVPRANQAAHDFLTAAGHSGTVTVAGNRVTVTVTITRPTQLLGLLGVGTVTATATGTAEAERGVTRADP
ncbi:TadG family pilus assembly protein [Actinokineospora cianjurensis]|uniref:DUF2134 domain-containing protein n=1 Tax=Actinokineospora cianjurensis TaxID=585224 RepID=A0A421BC70_9PSEU|nr:TadG family pilus assembly protein [Actinokineospora cianjurensis]RLK61920.1 hypothetical protein CLV68_2465 [Actinokineospora cianjurensis]